MVLGPIQPYSTWYRHRERGQPPPGEDEVKAPAARVDSGRVPSRPKDPSMPSDTPGRTPEVLCVVRDPALRQSIRDALAPAGWVVVDEPRGGEALAFCQADGPDLVLLECGVEGERALLEGLGLLDASARAAVVALGSSEACEEALRAGAADWMTTPIAGPLLVHRVGALLRAARAERALATTRTPDEDSDDATVSEPPPREHFLQRADAILRDPGQRRKHAAMLAISVEIADGPADEGALDACLPVLTRRLREVLRTRDGAGLGASGPVALLADRGFAVLLEREERAQEAYKVARRIQQQLEKPVDALGKKWNIRVNVGIAMHVHDGTSATEMHEAARKAMTLARQEQLHGIRFATAALNSSTFERLALESNLRYALERGELTLFYQPRVDLRTGDVRSFEALLRWKHPELGMVSPAQFVPIAEESGLIVPIGEWVLREACRQNQEWRAAGLPHVRMAVNLSSVQFRQPDLEVRIARVLEDTGLDPDGLELELTESMLLQDAEATIETLRTIREMGIHLAIDDFGTGYSSLSYIKRFPVHALKIDQSFVREVLTSPEDSAITTSIVLMGKSLDLTVVGEGVETRSQLEFLRVLECDEAQGYLFSRPVPAKEAGECLATGYASVLGASASPAAL